MPKSGGNAEAVPAAMTKVPDPRVRHFWDPEGASMVRFRPSLGIEIDVWDVYLAYAPGVVWDQAAPPRPSYWMHQLWGVTGVPELDGRVLAAEMAKLGRER